MYYIVRHFRHLIPVKVSDDFRRAYPPSWKTARQSPCTGDFAAHLSIGPGAQPIYGTPIPQFLCSHGIIFSAASIQTKRDSLSKTTTHFNNHFCQLCHIEDMYIVSAFTLNYFEFYEMREFSGY